MANFFKYNTKYSEYLPFTEIVKFGNILTVHFMYAIFYIILTFPPFDQ